MSLLSAIDLLIDLANQKAPQGLQVMNISYLLSEIGLFTKWWRPKGVGENVLSEHENTWKAAWASAYEYALSIPYGLALKCVVEKVMVSKFGACESTLSELIEAPRKYFHF